MVFGQTDLKWIAGSVFWFNLWNLPVVFLPKDSSETLGETLPISLDYAEGPRSRQLPVFTSRKEMLVLFSSHLEWCDNKGRAHFRFVLGSRPAIGKTWLSSLYCLSEHEHYFLKAKQAVPYGGGWGREEGCEGAKLCFLTLSRPPSCQDVLYLWPK